MKATLGSLLLLWGRIERAARDEVIRAHGRVPKSAYGIAAILRTWECTVKAAHPSGSLYALLAEALRAQLEELLNIRNGLCHGWTGISSANQARPATLQWRINDEDHCITWAELQASFSWLAKAPDAISSISSPHFDKRRVRANDSVENREWWAAEYGINLPR